MKFESHLNYEGKNSEIVATYILKELGYDILHSQGLENRKMNMGLAHETILDKKIKFLYRRIVGTYTGDILCKKGSQDYLFDVKLKFFKEGKNMNQFYITNNEFLDYNRLLKSGKVPVKILINLKKDDGYYYGIFDWSDFIYSKNYDPHKSRKTTIRHKDGLDISKFKKFENVKNYKFEKYLDIPKLLKTKKMKAQITFSFRCSIAGSDCRWSATATNEKMLMDSIAYHVKIHHKEIKYTTENLSKINSLIKEV